MTDEHLAHMCRLSTVVASMIMGKDFDVEDLCADEHPQNVDNMFKILAETFVELQSRAGLKPKFRVPTRNVA